MSVWTWPKPRRDRFLVAWALALACGASACALGAHAFRALPRAAPLEELSYYPSGEHVRVVALGHADAAADLAWLRAVQYYGEHRQTDNRFDKLPHVFDILTTLAPGFIPAYGFGAFSMAQEGERFADAEALMKKGLAANPRSGRLAFELGFLYYVKPGGRELRGAAEYFEQATRQADAPPQAARFAAYARQNAGDLRLAYELWAVVARTSPNRYLRQMAEKNMQRIARAIATGRADLAIGRVTVPRIVKTAPPAVPGSPPERPQESPRPVR